MYNQYSLTTDPENVQILLAFLADAGFDSFEEVDDGLLAFATEENHSEWIKVLDELRESYSFTYSYARMPDRNWNEVWESQFEPIKIGHELLIRANFHPSDPEVAHDLLIDPKMAFGTGHHATTYMMCQLLLEGEIPGTRVLDYGTGTGVLAILAKRLGATEVDAVDIEVPAVENTTENAQTNGVALDNIVLGELKDVPPGKPYDLVLANINRNVILATAGALYERLRPGGLVFFSGILEKDEQLLIDHLETLNYRHRETRAREDWRAFVFTRD